MACGPAGLATEIAALAEGFGLGNVRFDQRVAECAESLLLAATGLLLFENLESSEHLFFDGFWQSSVRHRIEDLVFLLDVLAKQSGELSHRPCERSAVLLTPSRRLLRESV